MSATLPSSVSEGLVRFLLDRLDEDDEQVRRLARDDARESAKTVISPQIRSAERLRAEIIAKRHVIGDLQQLLVLRDLPSEKTVRDAASQALRALAAPYTEHRQYRAEWRAPKRR